MSIFKRFNDIVNSNLNAMLDKAEDPQKLLRLMIVEMEQTLSLARADAAHILADKKALEREINGGTKSASGWREKAELALDKDKETLARAALVEAKRCDDFCSARRQALVELEKAYANLDSDVQCLHEKLQQAQARQRTFRQRQSSLENRRKIRVVTHHSAVKNSFSRLEAFEQKLDRIEAEVEAYDIGATKSLQQQFDDLYAGEAVENELNALKEKLKKTS